MSEQQQRRSGPRWRPRLQAIRLHRIAVNAAQREIDLMSTVTRDAVAAPATRAVNERRPADPRGTVEIVNTAGRVSVAGWERPEVEVTGTLAELVERLEFTRSGTRTRVRVVLRKGILTSGSGDAGEPRAPRCHARPRSESSAYVALLGQGLEVVGRLVRRARDARYQRMTLPLQLLREFALGDEIRQGLAADDLLLLEQVLEHGHAIAQDPELREELRVHAHDVVQFLLAEIGTFGPVYSPHDGVSLRLRRACGRG